MLIWALKHWRVIVLILAVLAALGALWQFGRVQYRKGYETCTAEQEKAEIEGVKTRGEIKTKNIRAPLSDIDKRLIADWLRDE